METELYICRFFYDGHVDDYLFEMASCTACEASNCWFCDWSCVRLDFPAIIPVNGFLAYLRKEPCMPPPEVLLLPRCSIIIEVAYLSYAMQQALLGRVVPSLRMVVVNVNEEKKMLYFYFYYDEKITEELLALSKEAIEIAKKAFSETFTSVEEIVFFPFPKRTPSIDGIGVYYRAENMELLIREEP